MIQTQATESRENADATRTRVQEKSAIVGTGAALRRRPAVGLSALGNQATLLRLSRTRPQLQCKLEIGAANDPLEAEADRIAEQVMRMPDDQALMSNAPYALRRKCAACKEEDRKEASGQLLRAPSGPASLERTAVPPIVYEVLSSPGRPLDHASRAFFEPRLGLDLGEVRLHDDVRAAESSRRVGARAYTVGQHIAVAQGFDTTSENGQRLLAHELVHVAQQNRNGAQQLAREEAPVTSSAASGALMNAADRISEYRGRATASLGNSGLAADDLARINRNLATCAAGEQRLRSVAQDGDDAASASVLSAFTLDGMRQVIPRLTRAYPVPQAVAVNESDNTGLATMPVIGPDLSSPLEREAESIASKLVPAGLLRPMATPAMVLRRYLDSAQAQQLEQAVAPAAPVIVGTAAATAAAIATAPLWVWIVVAVVVVAAAAALLYWAFSDDDSDTVAKAAPKTQPQTSPQSKPETETKPKPVPYDQPLSRTKPGDPKDESPCQLLAGPPLGGNDCHDRLAQLISGQPYEFVLVTPRGRMASYDAYDQAQILYEVKTGYRWLPFLRPDDPRRAETIERWQRQEAKQQSIAEECGYSLVWTFNEPEAAKFADGVIPVLVECFGDPTCSKKVFNCDRDCCD